MKHRVIYLVLLCLCATSAPGLFAQQKVDDINADSLENVLRNGAISDARRMDIHWDLSWYYLYADDYENIIRHSERGIAIAEKLDSLYVVADLYNNLGMAYDFAGKRDSAALCFDKALDLVRLMESDDYYSLRRTERIEALVYSNLGGLYIGTHNKTNEALDYYLKALRLFEKYNRLDKIANSFGNIGIVYYNVENYEQAEVYLLKKVEICRENGFEVDLAHALNVLSAVYLYKEDYTEALSTAREALAIIEKHGGSPLFLLDCYSTLSYIWLYGFGDDGKAMEYAGLALKKAEELNVPVSISESLLSQSEIFLFRGEYPAAERSALEALRTDSTHFSINQGIYEFLTKANIGMGRRERAFEYFDRFKELQMNYANENFQQQLSEMEVVYETEKKEAQIELLHHEKRFLTTLTLVSGGVFLLLVVLLLLLIRYQRLKRIRVQEQLEKAEQEKHLIAAESLLDGETHERERLSRELHDGLGGLLTMIKLDLAQIKATIANESQKLDDAIGLMDRSISEMRRLAHNLMPESLARFGLKPVLEEFCSGSDRVTFHFFGEEKRLDEKTEVNVYRIACELVNNALKHSDAATINVQLIQTPDKLSLTVSDNGKGMEETGEKEGLKTVRSRVELLRASMNIWSEPGKGTEITVETDLKSAEA